MTKIESTAVTAAAPTPVVTAREGASANYDMFLKLLTTQMQNQDPLNPTDSTQYTAQLAQFSQVEQSIQQTDALKTILSQLSTQDTGQLSNLIGREAEFDSPVAGLTAAAPATWSYTGGPGSPLVATITNAAGSVVDTRQIEPSAGGRFVWNGVLANGVRVPNGAYTLALTTADKTAVTPHAVGAVSDVLSSGGVVSLNVNGVPMLASSLVRVSGALN